MIFIQASECRKHIPSCGTMQFQNIYKLLSPQFTVLTWQDNSLGKYPLSNKLSLVSGQNSFLKIRDISLVVIKEPWFTSSFSFAKFEINDPSRNCVVFGNCKSTMSCIYCIIKLEYFPVRELSIKKFKGQAIGHS